jgi:hypothetical protein
MPVAAGHSACKTHYGKGEGARGWSYAASGDRIFEEKDVEAGALLGTDTQLQI